MTVAELIEELQRMDPEARVFTDIGPLSEDGNLFEVDWVGSTRAQTNDGEGVAICMLTLDPCEEANEDR